MGKIIIIGMPIAAKVRESLRFSKDDDAAAPQPSSAPPPHHDPVGADELDQGDRNSSTISTEEVEPAARDLAALAPDADIVVVDMVAEAPFEPDEPRPKSEAPRGNGQDPQDDFRNERKREWSTGSKSEAERDTYAEEHAGEPFNDAAIRWLGYALVRTHDYPLPDGTMLYQQNRYELRPGIEPTKKRPRKRFLPHRTEGGKEVLGAGARRVIYQWPAIMRAGPGSNVFVTEGEANADALIKTGLLATTVLSHRWAPECIAALTGHHLIILEDADDDGRKLAAAARTKLAPVAASIRIVPAAHLWKHLKPAGQEPPLHADVEDWLGAGGDPANLPEICRKVLPEGTRLTFIDMSRWDARARARNRNGWCIIASRAANASCSPAKAEPARASCNCSNVAPRRSNVNGSASSPSRVRRSSSMPKMTRGCCTAAPKPSPSITTSALPS